MDRLHLILDISGSMREMGKLLLARNLVAFTRELLEIMPEEFSFREIRLFTWNEVIQPVELTANRETSHFEASGKTDLARLKEFLESQTENKTGVKAIILSDGSFSNNFLLNNFNTWHKENPHLTLYAVGIGADAYHSNLRKLSTNNRVFCPEDLFPAIRSLVAYVDGDMDKPPSVNEISLPSDQEDEEAWD